MPCKGYKGIASLNETDFHGIVSVIINNKRLQNKLSKKGNLCIKLRQMSNEFRHSANLSVDDNDFVERLDLLIELLQDPKYLVLKTHCQDAVKTLRQLKTDTFEISSKQVSRVLSDAIKDREHTAVKNISEQEQITLKVLHELNAKYIEEAKVVTANSLAEVIDTKVSTLLEVTEFAKKEKASIARTGNREQRKLQRTAKKLKSSFERDDERGDIQDEGDERAQQKTSKHTDSQLKQELRDELIEFYKGEHKYLPISPLIDSNKAPLLDFYVGPTMYYIDMERQPFRNEESKFTQPVKSYRDIFFKDNQRCKNIYVTSRAGSGKTCFSKRMTLAWCQAWKPEDSKRECFEIENIEAMKDFGFVFLISLRECLSKECDVDDIIQKQLISNLPGWSAYPNIMQDLLHSEDCLIVIDGLDEWSHPTKKKKKCHKFMSKIPHRKFRTRTTILTTSRRWKFHTITQDNVQIDQHVEMTGLDNESAQMLAKNVITHLNSRSEQSKSPDDFRDMLEAKGLHKFIHFPLILMQLLSLWYDGRETGESKCQIFSNMLELLFIHAKRRSNFEDKFKNIPHKKGKRSNKTLPRSFTSAPLCQKYNQVLNSLSKLAYETMFGENFDNSLVFDHSIVKRYLSDDEFSLCLETGILLQSKENGKLTSEDLNYSFLHKTFQELLAALFISSKTDLPKNMLPKILKKIKCVDNILHMDMFLIFLSGFSSTVIKSLSEEFVALMSKEEMTERYRRNIGTIFVKDFDKMHELSDLLVSCLEESNNNGHDADVYLGDIFVDQKCTDPNFRAAMSKLIAYNNGTTMKSLYVQVHQTVNTEKIDLIMKDINIDSVHSLEKLCVWGNIQASNVNSLLINSNDSMKCLELWHQSHTEDELASLQKMNNVSGFSLLSIEMHHSQIVKLMSYISANSVLEQLNLNDIECIDHGEECPGYELDVCQKAKPRLFLVDKLHVTKVSVNAEHMQMCVAKWLFKEGALDSLLTCLKGASSLKRFECDGPESERDTKSLITSVPLFENLNYFRLRNVKICSGKLNLSNMTGLMRVHIWHASMTAEVFGGIVKDVESLGKSVIVILDECDITPDDRENKVREYVKNCGKFEVIKEALGKYRQFHFKSLSK
ncbi:uncharacterized protein LOC123526248 [Mercenaria mercenaria]|uniref:uncharacterized protein LOC123526248 n=1 Tax=Mercenaria mercenaria TaxID=6596 RepID=UPI00234E5A40|nr:uncharacterized protein LOC123526248 [Mercenaria mercenaria]XP_045161251.2 uncharacterized protein LOC123526248 [Mercenaria mercenaria]XP_053378863.1 uncharacterized protein LOC123526248 [Mercenaria mercenaria]